MSKWQKYNDWADTVGWIILIVVAGSALAWLCFGVYAPGKL